MARLGFARTKSYRSLVNENPSFYRVKSFSHVAIVAALYNFEGLEAYGCMVHSAERESLGLSR